MEERSLPGLQARYEFVPGGETVELRLRLGFDPAEAGPPEAARTAWAALRDRLAGGTEGKPAPATIRLVTSLAAAPLTTTADGGEPNERFAAFVADVIAAFDRTDASGAGAELAFSLARAGAAELPSDIFRLDVRLDLGVGAEPMTVASPKLDGDPGAIRFATAFEEAWRGFDGADSRLALASAGEPGQAEYWCVKAGAALGIAVAGPASAEATHYVVPPLSTVSLAGTIGDSDGGGAVERFESVDLDHWWDIFAAELDRLAMAEVAGEARERLESARGALARALAGRLVPVTGEEAGDGIEEVRAVAVEAATADLRSRPAAVSAEVEVIRSASLLGESPAVLHGRASTPSGTSSPASASPAAVRLEAGRQRLAYVAPTAPGGQARQAFPIRFEGERIERGGTPPLRLILPAASGESALEADLGPQSVPLPLIGLPAAPAFSASSIPSSSDAATLSAALAWTVEIEISATPAAQDRLDLALGFETAAMPARWPNAAPEGELFQALGRAVRFAGAAPAEPDPETLERFAILAEAVAQALPAWRPPEPETRPPPGDRRYSIDFSELPALIVGREPQGSGQRPLWPAIAGYVTPESEAGTARYDPEAGTGAGAGLRLSIAGLRLLADRIVQVHGRIRRNGGIAETVDPAFIYHSAIASVGGVRPRLEWRAPQTEPPAASLDQALGALLGAIDEDSEAPYGLGLRAELVQRLEPAGEAPLETRIPLGILPRTQVGGGEGPSVAELKRQVATALSTARAGIGPDRRDAEIALAISVFDEEPGSDPLARLNFRLPVPDDEAWWEPVAA